MNSDLQKLCSIAQKPARHIIGLMSGTSLDGLDIALCAVSGQGETTQVQLLNFCTVDYDDNIKSKIRSVFAKKTVDFQQLALLNEWIGELHAKMIVDTLRKWNVVSDQVDLIASHGQTVMHAPKALHQIEGFGNATLQIGDGDHIAVKTGITTVSDFRQKHIAAGGEGAPLAVYGDYYLFSHRGQSRIMLNMGGIANFTYLPSNQDAQLVFVTDTGPGNTLLDAFTRLHFPSLPFDKDAAIARQGSLSTALLTALLDHPFFTQTLPKTTGPELFNLDYLGLAQSASATTDLPVADVMATLVEFSATSIATAILETIHKTQTPVSDFHVYMSGGGAHNPLLVQRLREKLQCTFHNTDELGIQGDAKEAVLFAVLANETVAGGQSDFGTRKGIPSVAMGKISFPN
jgi:anhydro-N-acetylmuramic acid kinase